MQGYERKKEKFCFLGVNALVTYFVSASGHVPRFDVYAVLDESQGEVKIAASIQGWETEIGALEAARAMGKDKIEKHLSMQQPITLEDNGSGDIMVFFRAAQRFADANDVLTSWNEIGRERAIEVALLECSEGLSSTPRDKLTGPAIGWVSELDSFLDYSGLSIPRGKGGIATKAATLTAEDVGHIAELVKKLQAWFSAENKKGL